MKITKIVVGSLETNCYILDVNNNCLIIDPGDDLDKIVKEINVKNPVGIIITHYHFDHYQAMDDLKKKYNVEVYDIFNLKEGINKIGVFDFEVIYTKGHHDTCITIYFDKEKIMFTGDFLFKNTIGRIDLIGANKDEMIKSINKIKLYNDDVKIYPGHGDTTTLNEEKINNYYFNNLIN